MDRHVPRTLLRLDLMRLTAALLALLSAPGCKPGGSRNTSAPPEPGVSEPLAYPVLLIGQNTVDVRDSEEELISITGASGLNLVERVIVDSDGRLFSVERATSGTGTLRMWLDMGTRPRRFAVEVREERKPSWAKVQALLLEQVNAPNSVWAGDSRAVAKVQSLRSVEEAIAACRETWTWMR